MREATAVNVLPAIAALKAAKGAGAAELGEISAELRSIVAPLLALQPTPDARQVTTRARRTLSSNRVLAPLRRPSCVTLPEIKLFGLSFCAAPSPDSYSDLRSIIQTS